MSDARSHNRALLAAYFEAGCKDEHNLGFELEHILLRKEGNAPVSYAEEGGVHDVLLALAGAYQDTTFENGNIVALSRSRETVTIEPAGQLEISAGPYSSPAEVERAYLAFRDLLDPILERFGLYAPLVGYNPSAYARDLPLVPKARYEFMNHFLGEQAYSSVCMMRGTASLQVSVDYASESDAAQKLRVAEKITPILALMCDNSPVFECAPVAGHLARTGVWSGMKQDRVGTIPGSLDSGFGFEAYADYIMTREAILIPDKGEPEGWRYVGGATFDELYHDHPMDDEALEHALTMVWPDARLKNFVEIRPADALPPDLAIAYTALVEGLFYDTGCLDALDKELASVSEDDIVIAKRDLTMGGYGAQSYGKPAAYWADLIVSLAQEGGAGKALDPLASLVESRITPKECAQGCPALL